jgi:hypothetical protein
VALVLIVPVAVALLSVVLGRAARDERGRWAGRRLLVHTAARTLAAVIGAIVAIEPDVPAGQAARGVALSAVFLGLVPPVVYYTVGYFVRPWWVLVPVLIVLAAASFFYGFFALLIVLDAVVCGPDAHECPL